MDELSRLEQKKLAHQKTMQVRVDEQNKLKLSYKRIKDEPAFLDILKNAKMLMELHERIAKDGVGAEVDGVDSSGNDKMKFVVVSGEKRLFEFERSLGIEEVISMIERKITPEALKQIKPKVIVS